jgi:hypothetical protein
VWSVQEKAMVVGQMSSERQNGLDNQSFLEQKYLFISAQQNVQDWA